MCKNTLKIKYSKIQSFELIKISLCSVCTTQETKRFKNRKGFISIYFKVSLRNFLCPKDTNSKVQVKDLVTSQTQQKHEALSQHQTKLQKPPNKNGCFMFGAHGGPEQFSWTYSANTRTG